MVFAQNKRPFSDDESCPLASKKHAGHLEINSQLPASIGIGPCGNLHHRLSNSGIEGDTWPSKCEDSGTVSYSVEVPKILAGGKFRGFRCDGPPDLIGLSTKGTSGGIRLFSDANVFPGEEIIESGSPMDEPDTVEMQDSFQRDVLTQIDESVSPAIDCYYRKPVAIGPNHQADVPSWDLQCDTSLYSKELLTNHASSSSFSKTIFLEDVDDLRRMGSCIIQMPDMESDVYSVRTVGYGRINCTCPDRRSVRCVRQHIAEEREKMKSLLGQEILVELGFDEMGEDVDGRWSMEEEHLFWEVVYSNPVSLGKNFWNELSLAFPARSKKELVSYYFNVFVLRRRALQNRWVICDADSDNDEWQGSSYDELAVSEEDDDSVLESEALDKVGHIANYVLENDDEYEYEYEDDDDDDDEEDVEEDEEEEHELNKKEGEEEELVLEYVSGEPDTYARSSKPNDVGCGSDMGLPHDETIHSRCLGDQDVQDEPCMSFECYPNNGNLHNSSGTSVIPYVGVPPKANAKAKAKANEGPITSDDYGNKESASVFGQGFLSEQPCDSKVWDVGFLPVSRKDVDILPTCSMMKEVFGEEAWHNEAFRDSSRII